MENREIALIVEKLKDGEKYVIEEGDCGKAEIWKINDVYVAFEIPMYGGQPTHFDTASLHSLHQLLYKISRLT